MIISCIDRCGRSHMTYWKGVVLGDEDQDGKRRILLPYGSHSSLPLILKVPCFLTIFFSPLFTYCYFCLFPKCDASHLVLLQCISPWPFLKLTGWFPFFILVWFLISVVSTIIEQPVSHHLAPTPAPNGKKNKQNKTKQQQQQNLSTLQNVCFSLNFITAWYLSSEHFSTRISPNQKTFYWCMYLLFEMKNMYPST